MSAGQSLWWNTRPRANSTPLAVLFVHIGKTGGGSIVNYLLRRNPRFDLKLDYSRSRLFIGLHADIFADSKLALWALPGGAFAGARPVWEHTRVAVQYHDRAIGTFWTTVAPKLDLLRRRYAAAGGKLAVVTTMREPMSMIVSWYRQWPGRLPNRTIAPFRDWVRNASGLITRALTYGPNYGPAKIWHTTRVPYFGCPADLAAKARDRLISTFDVVGDVADVGWTLRTVVRGCLGWPSSALPSQTPHISYLGTHRSLTLHETDERVLRAASDGRDSTWSRLERAAECDMPLYKLVRGGHVFTRPASSLITPPCAGQPEIVP